MIEKLVYFAFILFIEYFSCVDTEQESFSYLGNVLFFVSGLCFGYCFAYRNLRSVINDDIDVFLIEYSVKKK